MCRTSRPAAWAISGRNSSSGSSRTCEAVASSQPIVVFAHIPLWTVYQEWGWGTDDGAQALSYLKRFGSVTVLNGHIHQIMQKVEGNVAFHTAPSTAFPSQRPAPRRAPARSKTFRPESCVQFSVSRTSDKFWAPPVWRSSTLPSLLNPTNEKSL